MKQLTRVLLVASVVVLGLLLGARVVASLGQGRTRVATVALRVHDLAAMEAFYAEAFGVRFRDVDTAGIPSRFGEMGQVTLKLVPIRVEADFEGFPVLQLGLEVADIDAVVGVALRHGGRLQDAPRRDGEGIHAAIRDPDGNTIELYQHAPSGR